MKGWRILLLVLGLTVFGFLAIGQAQEKYPSRAIELVIPFAPGGSSDRLARIFGDELAQVLKTRVIMVNRPGGSGIKAATYVTMAKKDGHVLFEGTATSLGIMPIISKEVKYDPVKDFIALGHFASVPSIVSVRSDSPFQTLNDLIEFVRKNPGQLNNASAGFDVSYINLEIICSESNIKIKTIPFRSGGETLPAFLGGHVDMLASTVTTLRGQIEAGKVRGLAITSRKRHPDFPNIPTTAELGYPAANLRVWIGVFAPAGVSQQVQSVLITALEKVFTTPEVVKRAEKAGFTVEYMNPGEFREFLDSEIQKIRKVAQDHKLDIK